MITLNNTKLDTASNATLNNCLVLSSVSDSICTDTVSPIFVNCTENSTLTLDPAWLTADNKINTIGQAALKGLASDGGELIEWAYAVITNSLTRIIAQQKNKALPGYLVSSLIDDIDPSKSVLISITPKH
jgi:hypothetical protein